MPRWLSMEEAMAELRVGEMQIRALLKNKLLVGVNCHVDGGSNGWRILDPSEKLREHLLEPDLERFPLLTTAEVAEVLGISRATVTGHVFTKKLKPHPGYSRNGSTVLFTPKEVRHFLAYREGRKGPGSRSYSRTLVRWLKAYLENNSREVARALDETIRDAVILPEPERSRFVHLIWEKFDQIEDLVKQCRKLKAG